MEKVGVGLVCPRCKGPLSGLHCEREGVSFETFRDYANFVGGNPQEETTTEEYAESQEQTGYRVFSEYVRPWLAQEAFSSVLDVGCGMGRGVEELASEGRKAYGVDLPNLAPFWETRGNDPTRFFIADAVGKLPFRDDSFDAVYSLGVIEHIGTTTGHLTLSADYEDARRAFASELLRVTAPGGRILISCPHKRFPFDIQHGPGDSESPAGSARGFLWRKGHVTVHKTWGRYYLPSYSEVERWFGRRAKPLPLKGYFGFLSFEHPALRPFLTAANFYVDNLPAPLRRTPLNPYILAEIRK